MITFYTVQSTWKLNSLSLMDWWVSRIQLSPLYIALAMISIELNRH